MVWRRVVVGAALAGSGLVGASCRTIPSGPVGGAESFADGEHTVGKGVASGLYESKTPGPDCHWVFETVANTIKGPGHIGEGRSDPAAAQDRWVLELAKDDKLTTTGCGTWTKWAAPEGEPPTTLSQGTYLVGPEAKAGNWKAAGTFVTVEVYGLEGANRGGGSSTLRTDENWNAVCAPDPDIPDCRHNTKGLGVSEGQFIRVTPAPGSTLVWYG